MLARSITFQHQRRHSVGDHNTKKCAAAVDGGSTGNGNTPNQADEGACDDRANNIHHLGGTIATLLG
jgi:hypothetical protein